MENPSIVWFRQDLRVEDQPALQAALSKQGPIIPLFIWSPEEEKEWAPGAASRWWLHGALERLQHDLKSMGLTLILRKGSSRKVLEDIVKKTGADTVFLNRRFEPLVMERDAGIKSALHQMQVKVQIFNGSLLFEPWNIMNKQGKPFQIFTYFWKNCCELGEPHLLPAFSGKAVSFKEPLASEALSDLDLLPTIAWDKGLKEKWHPNHSSRSGTPAIDEIIRHYQHNRDYPAIAGTSEFSPYLHFGEVSPRQIWSVVRQKFGHEKEAEVFLRQLGWREFAHYVLFHFPRTPTAPMHPKFATIRWEKNPAALHAWQKGMTGYPIVDAGMRQLWHTGWMHNRVRMIVGSFLVKDLFMDWQEGARWFWDTLVDADLANNTLGWQWVAGCGADAAPYFRIFNPVLQGEKFDKEGDYVRHWVPELKALPNRWIHRPWEASAEVLRAAGVELGVNYPHPIENHDEARKKALSMVKSYS